MSRKIKDIPYVDIFKKSWDLTFRHRYLWWFGLFASLSSIASSVTNYSHPEKNNRTADFISRNPIFFVFLLAVFLLLYVLILVIGLIGRGALISSIESEIKNRTSNFRPGFSEGKKYFWNIFILSLTLILFFAATIFVLAMPVLFLFYRGAIIPGAILASFAILIMIPLLVMLVFAKEYGYLYVVLGKLSAFSALEAAYNLFLENAAASIVMGLLMIPVLFILILAIFCIIIVLALIFLVLGLLTHLIMGNIGSVIIVVIAAILFLVIVLALRSVFETFVQSAWVLFFHEIASPKEKKPQEEVVEEEKAEVLPSASPVKTAQKE